MLILIAHGSREPRWRASVEELAESLQRDLGLRKPDPTELGPLAVRLAYMECAPPTLMDVASEAVRAGVKKIRVLPLFLTGQGHVDCDIRAMVDEVRKAWATLEVDLLPPVGQHPLFRELLYSIAIEQSGQLKRIRADAADRPDDTRL